MLGDLWDTLRFALVWLIVIAFAGVIFGAGSELGVRIGTAIDDYFTPTQCHTELAFANEYARALESLYVDRERPTAMETLAGQ